MIRQAALASHVKGVTQSKTVVTERVAVMDLGENGLQGYRLGQCLLSVFPFPNDPTYSSGCLKVTLASTRRNICTD